MAGVAWSGCSGTDAPMHAARAQAGCLKWALPLVALALSAAPALGQTAVASGAGGVPLPAAAEGVPISRVDVALVDDAGTPARASAFMVAVRTAFSEFAGQPFSRYVVEQRLRDLRTRLGAPRLSYRLTPGGSDPGSVVLRVEVDASAAPLDELSPEERAIRREDHLAMAIWGAYELREFWLDRGQGVRP